MQADNEPNWIMYFDERFRAKFDADPTPIDRCARTRLATGRIDVHSARAAAQPLATFVCMACAARRGCRVCVIVCLERISDTSLACALCADIAALYWSVMTLTSIGYGEMTAESTKERLFGSIWMMLSGVMWTYVIGSVAGIASNLDPSNTEYQNTMDALNYFSTRLPIQLRTARVATCLAHVL
jgi:hypothetical protein